MGLIDESLLVRNSPQSLQIEVTSRCNLTCKMCPLTTGDTLSSVNPGHMTDVLWNDILPLAKRYGSVTLTGYGEPFLNPGFLPLLKELNQAKVVVGLSTNGTPITPSVARELAALEYVAHYNFSIDSPVQQSYRDIRGGNVDKALKGLRTLVGAIDDPGKVTVSSVLMAQNMRDLALFPEILADLGVRKFFLQGLMDYNDSCSEAQLIHHPELFDELDKIFEEGEKFGVEVTMLQAERMELERHRPKEASRRFHAAAMQQGETKQCSVPWEVPFIDRDGRVFPCCNASKDSAAVMGDLTNESWDDTWNGSRFRNFRERLLDGTNIPSICQGCNASNGKHPLLYAGRVLEGQSRLVSRRRFRLVVLNIGRHTWTQDDPIHIGTIRPLNRISQLAHPTWISPNRPAHFNERRVAPGETATFDFETCSTAEGFSEPFSLVYDGMTWMPNTDFTVSVCGRATDAYLATRSRLGALAVALRKVVSSR